MKAVVLTKSGNPSVLKISDVDLPIIGDNEVLIKTAYAGINFAELLSRNGTYSWAPKKPYILGMECSGEITAVGNKVTQFQKGDLVAAAGKFGSYAEYRAVHQNQIFKLPKNLNLKEGAALIVTFATAWVALHEMARVRKGETILIQSAAGGVGLACVELATIHGLKVYGTASSKKKRDFIESKGCIPLSYDDFDEILLKAGLPDCVIETVGGSVYQRSFKVLAPLGRIILVGASGIHINKKNPLSLYRAWKQMPKTDIRKVLRFSKGFMGLHVGYLLEKLENFREILDPLLTILEDNDIKPLVLDSQIYPLSKAAEAHQFIQDRKNIGKVLLDTSK